MSLSNELFEIFSKTLHFLMSVTQDCSKFLFACDYLYIIQKAWETLDLAFEANIILSGSLNAKLSRDTLELYEVN